MREIALRENLTAVRLNADLPLKWHKLETHFLYFILSCVISMVVKGCDQQS